MKRNAETKFSLPRFVTTCVPGRSDNAGTWFVYDTERFYGPINAADRLDAVRIAAELNANPNAAWRHS